jgi:hypothetical protein
MDLRSRLSLLFLVLAGVCHTAQTTHAQDGAGKARQQRDAEARPAYQQVAEARLGKGVRYTLNQAGTMVLGLQVEPGTRPAHLNTNRLVVIRLKDNSLLYEDQIANARVTWCNDTQLQVFPYPGTVQRNGGHRPASYLIDLQTRQKVFLPAEKL